MKNYIIILLLVLTSVSLRAQDSTSICPKALPLIVQQVLNVSIVQDALYKQVGRNMYPMYIIYPKQSKTKQFTMDGFVADSLKIESKDFSENKSTLEVTKYKYDKKANVYKIKFQYNKKLTISIQASINYECTKANITQVLVYSKDGSEPDFSFSNSPTKDLRVD